VTAAVLPHPWPLPPQIQSQHKHRQMLNHAGENDKLPTKMDKEIKQNHQKISRRQIRPKNIIKDVNV
jgi:hypothetical protein